MFATIIIGAICIYKFKGSNNTNNEKSIALGMFINELIDELHKELIILTKDNRYLAKETNLIDFEKIKKGYKADLLGFLKSRKDLADELNSSVRYKEAVIVALDGYLRTEIHKLLPKSYSIKDDPKLWAHILFYNIYLSYLKRNGYITERTRAMRDNKLMKEIESYQK